MGIALPRRSDHRPTGFRLGRKAPSASKKETSDCFGARVFSEEVMDPRSYSKRTLEILKVLGHDEALVLSKIAPRVTHGSLLHTGDNNDELVDGIPFKECL